MFFANSHGPICEKSMRAARGRRRLCHATSPSLGGGFDKMSEILQPGPNNRGGTGCSEACVSGGCNSAYLYAQCKLAIHSMPGSMCIGSSLNKCSSAIGARVKK